MFENIRHHPSVFRSIQSYPTCYWTLKTPGAWYSGRFFEDTYESKTVSYAKHIAAIRIYEEVRYEKYHTREKREVFKINETKLLHKPKQIALHKLKHEPIFESRYYLCVTLESYVEGLLSCCKNELIDFEANAWVSDV